MLRHDTAFTALTIAGFCVLMLAALLAFWAARNVSLRRLRFGYPDLTAWLLALLALVGGVCAWPWFWATLWPQLH
jgi:hypothetical protein